MSKEKQRKRLIEILSQPIFPKKGVDPAEVVADYLLDNGVLVPPCKVGDTVYQIIPKCSPAFGMCPYNGGYGTARCDKGPCKAHIKEISFSLSDIENIGKTVFLTREEAEKALEGMQ